MIMIRNPFNKSNDNYLFQESLKATARHLFLKKDFNIIEGTSCLECKLQKFTLE